ncbi:MrcB family domain-containing protein [Brevibacillus laterosporus]|uniref:MrcB family domain-containing protein n=1 Tax=Brevibacillus laterosporus TaxID=1465 RepID=UPI0035A738B3
MDERITRTTTNGIYIVLLLDEQCENIYITIAFGTEKIGKRRINEIATQIISTFEMSRISVFQPQRYILDQHIEQKNASSVCIWSKHSIRTVTEEEIITDLQVPNKLYYDYIFEVYSNHDFIVDN